MTHVERRQPRAGKETIHSGHFMVSHFEAEAQDDFDDLAVPVLDEEHNCQKVAVVSTYISPGTLLTNPQLDKNNKQQQQLSIETSLTKLFKCMTLAYRQKLTSPKWNRFKGIKLRWKEKIRLNNVIWRCWHMQFIKKQNTLVCQFASPLDVDLHVKPETTILEGKYWKRRAEAVIAEYKKWRMFHFTRILDKGDAIVHDAISDMDTVETFSQGSDLAGSMLMDEDYLNLMSDTLFSTITSHQPFAFPDPREIARGANLADFIQPSLGPLQPNLDDFMDTLEPLHDLLSMSRLPPVPEETTMSTEDPSFRSSIDSFNNSGYITNQNTTPTIQNTQMSIQGPSNNTQILNMSANVKTEQMQMQMYEGTLMFGQDSAPEPPSYSHGYEQHYSGKARVHYAAPQKVMSDANYVKYNSAVPPSQSAPETVSLLQQPVHSPTHKYASTIVMQGRGYTRDKPRPRVTHYPPSHLSGGGVGGVTGVGGAQYGYSQGAVFDSRASLQRQSPPQLQYLQPVDTYKQGAHNNRSFKMPSPPLAAPVVPQQIPTTISRVSPATTSKDGYRSNSLPIGAQLNTDWTINTQVQENIPRHTARGRESCGTGTGGGGAIRYRSRSSSSGTMTEAGPRRPPLNSVASDPALPQASVVLAQLLSQQHSQSMYKLSSPEDNAVMSESASSPIRRGQPSPINTDITSPLQQSASPSTSPPPSPGSPREPRRTHMHAEQKRRYNIKNGFDTLQALIPHLNNNPTAKISKAAMLQKGAEYIKQLKAERNQIKEEMENLKQEVERLNNSISNCHSLLPATGAPVSRARAGRLREMFGRHVANRTLHNWKYWLFSVVARALVESFSACVSCGSGADLVRTTLLWAEQHCSLVEMRPAVLTSLRVLCTTTDILSNPERLPDEARAAAASSSSVKTEPT